MASRFFSRGYSDSDSDSSSDSSSASSSGSDSEVEKPQQPTAGAKKPAAGAAAAAPGFTSRYVDSDSDSDDQKRVVKSAKDKRFDEIKSAIQQLENAKNINDWSAIQKHFESLTKLYTKSQTIIQKEGIPPFFIRSLVNLEDALKTSLESKNDKKMSSASAKALNSMKQKVKKYNKGFEKEIEEFRKNPITSDDEAKEKEQEEDSDSDSESDSDAEAKKPAATKKPVKKPAGSDDSDESEDDSDDDDSMFDSDSDSSDSSLDLNDGKKGIDRWLKKQPDEKQKDDKPKPKQVRIDDPKKEQKKAEESSDKVAGKTGKAIEINPEQVPKKLKEIAESRGKKNVDKNENILLLNHMLEISTNPVMIVRIFLVLIPAEFDFTPGASSSLATDTWKSIHKHVTQLLTLLDKNRTIQVREDFDDEEYDENGKEIEKRDENGVLRIRGSIVSFVDRLDDEFTKSLQNIDPHTTEYVDRLKDETDLYILIVRAQRYFASVQFEDSLMRCMLRRVEHLYYKRDLVNEQVETLTAKELEYTAELDPTALMHSLCCRIYKHSNDRLRARAVLCHVYHHALHDRFHTARDLILMSHLADTIGNADVSTQILYNRALVQLGLCAFRSGMISEAQNCLQEFLNTGRLRELLAQGAASTRYTEKSREQEKLERQLELPFHMHINVELIECVYLVSSMLIEIPGLASVIQEDRKRMKSKPFRRLLDMNERQIFQGPPENTREHVLAASRALAAGDWHKCKELICSIRIWDLMPDSTKIKEMLQRKIQEEALRTYFFTFGQFYEAMGLDELASMFDLPRSSVYSLVSKMIINEELHGALDQPSGTLVLHRTEPSRLQHLALQYADKLAGIVESNERQVINRTGGFDKFEQRTDRTGRGGRTYPQGGSRETRSYGQQRFQTRTGGQGDNRYDSRQRGGRTGAFRKPTFGGSLGSS